MRYIRTDIGFIIDTQNTYPFIIADGYIDFNSLGMFKIQKEADTIEELCDEFVGVDKTCENGHQLLRAIPYKCAKFWNGGVYGAIWTDKGLIYVAKFDWDARGLVLLESHP